MKNWTLKVKDTPTEVMNKLGASLKSFGEFVFNTDQDKEGNVLFNFRKRVMYPDQILHRNRTIVNGKIFKSDDENETYVDITFKQHFFMTMTIFSVVCFGLGLLFIISQVSSGISMFISLAIVLAISILLILAIQKKLKNDIENYKALISDVFAS